MVIFKNTKMSKQKLITAITIAVILCLLIEQNQAKPKKGCEAFGHACYGGHGKRSVAQTVGLEEFQGRPDAVAQVFSNDGKAFEQYRRSRVMNFLKQLINANGRVNDNDVEYPVSGEIFKENPGLN
ncbi:uncharacterized protein LOC129612061 isoform X2 [Condylostylus longicornis]|uniref:uncharacterized protein LOC129612061 isoform X2 n=2 Tax=Condylostylus longicornis TaxID=2530218 RepID=UPI00244DEF2B|nr:uncharacterized protein LOC129612061 isoform X2 [Condylostylus longicornis]